MIKDLFKEEDYHIQIIKQNSPKIIGTTYGFEFNNSLFLPKESMTDVVENIRILKFAKDPFLALWKDLKFYSSIQRIPKSSLFHFSNMKPLLGYMNAFSAYENYISLIVNSIEKTKAILSFNEFALKAMKLLLNYGNSISLSEFIRSNMVSIFNTGLAIQLLNAKASMDEINRYLNDSYYEVFRNLCLTHNFVIDANLPWVIVYRVDDSTAGLTNAYVNVYEVEVTTLIQVITYAWKAYIESGLGEEDRLLIDVRDKNVNSTKFLNLYIQIKGKEQGVDLSDSEVALIRIYMTSNTHHNGLSNSIQKLSLLRKGNDTIYKDWTKLFSENRSSSVNPSI